MLEFNIAPNTQIGRVMINQQVYEHENAFNIEEGKYSRGGEFLENFVTDNIIEFSRRWLHLAGFEEMLNDINEFYTKFCIGNYQDMYYSNSPILPVLSGNESEVICTNRSLDLIEFDNQYNRPKEYTFANIQKGLTA